MSSQYCIRTCSLPKEIVRDPILGPIWIRLHALTDVEDTFALAGRFGGSAAVVDMHMSTHLFAHQVAEHRRPVVVSAELATVELDGAVLVIQGPSRLGHGAMARFVLLLGVFYSPRQCG